MAEMDKNTTNWPDLAGALYDELTERHAVLTYDFDNVEVSVPIGTGEKSEHSLWKFSGSISIRGRNME